MRIENLPALHSITPSLIGDFFVNGEKCATLPVAKAAVFRADVQYLTTYLENWHSGLCYYLRSPYAPLHGEWIEGMRRVRAEIDQCLAWLRNYGNESEAGTGAFVRHRILPAVENARPRKENTQPFVNWFRLQYLAGLFADKYSPLSAQPAPRDEYDWAGAAADYIAAQQH